MLRWRNDLVFQKRKRAHYRARKRAQQRANPMTIKKRVQYWTPNSRRRRKEPSIGPFGANIGTRGRWSIIWFAFANAYPKSSNANLNANHFETRRRTRWSIIWFASANTSANTKLNANHFEIWIDWGYVVINFSLVWISSNRTIGCIICAFNTINCSIGGFRPFILGIDIFRNCEGSPDPSPVILFHLPSISRLSVIVFLYCSLHWRPISWTDST